MLKSVIKYALLGTAALSTCVKLAIKYEETQWTLPGDLVKGKVAVVTGANSGLGLETSRALAEAGATVILGCRDQGRCEAAAESIKTQHPSADVRPMFLDLADLNSVKSFASQVRPSHQGKIYVLNMRHIVAPPYLVTLLAPNPRCDASCLAIGCRTQRWQRR